ncbi:DoxX family membrane protein [Cryobacterium adonitolivorans]|uniref:DoxX family membrane protein n=1 Tax=Cryobacterium adonitolivorans TaxID=1259189 RepID=A0A4R8W3P8_9MICO|nr:DoxX family protein [Cryobacterium adonitolivorans]TFC01099.1 DoxX family membrane protein [Cryobacterium adonitolivorans]
MSPEAATNVLTVLRIVLAVVFVGAGISHFAPPVQRTMAAMIPPRLRVQGLLAPMNLVIFTGLCEIAGGIGLLIESTRVTSGVALAVFLVAVFPANAYAARHKDRFGAVAIPLVPRLLGQLALIGLVLVAGLAG